MKPLKFLLFFIVSILISKSAIAQINLVYVNGIQNTITQADDTRRIIRDILNNSQNHITDRKTFSVTGVWNPMGWRGDNTGKDLSQDLMELFLLKTAEEIFSNDFLQIIRLKNDRTSIDKNAASRVNAFIEDMTPGNNTIETNGSIADADMSVTRQAILNLVTRIKAVGGPAIVIAHSQGNLIANLAYARLASDGFDVPNKLKIINIANTSEFSASGLNFTHAGDAAIFSSATATLLKDQSLETLPSQFSNWNRTTPRCTNNACNFTVAPATFDSPSTNIPNQSTVDETLDHSIVETYLSTANLASRIEQGIIFTTNANRFIDRFEDFVYSAISTLTPPTATISIITPSPQANSGVIFQPNITASPNGAVTEFEWDFGDGTIQMGTAGQISHTYTSGGSYTVKLKIKDAKGATNLSTGSVTVTTLATLVSSGSTPTRNALISPNGGESWRSGVPQTITWKTDVINSSLVNFYVLHDDPSGIIFGSSGAMASNINSRNWVNVGRNIPNTGNYTLDPAVLSGTGNAYMFMVVSATDNSKYDVSDCTFALNVQMSSGGCAVVAQRDADGRIFAFGSTVPADVVSVGVYWPNGAPRSLFTPDPVTRQWAGLSPDTGYTAGQSIEVYYYNNVETSNPLTVWIQ